MYISYGLFFSFSSFSMFLSGEQAVFVAAFWLVITANIKYLKTTTKGNGLITEECVFLFFLLGHVFLFFFLSLLLLFYFFWKWIFFQHISALFFYGGEERNFQSMD